MRRTLVWTLIVAASVIAVISILTTWVRRQMLDEESWRKASAELIADPQVRQTLSVYIVNELYDNVNVGGELQSRLPPDLKGLAAPAAGVLRQAATDGVERLLEGPRVQQLFARRELARPAETRERARGQDRERDLDRGWRGHARSQPGGGRARTGARGSPQATMDWIPPDTGVITIMSSSELATAQTDGQGVPVLSSALLVLVLVMYALAIYLARGHRRATLRNVGWAFVIVGLVVLVARRLRPETYAVEALASPLSRTTRPSGPG